MYFKIYWHFDIKQLLKLIPSGSNVKNFLSFPVIKPDTELIWVLVILAKIPQVFIHKTVLDFH